MFSNKPKKRKSSKALTLLLVSVLQISSFLQPVHAAVTYWVFDNGYMTFGNGTSNSVNVSSGLLAFPRYYVGGSTRSLMFSDGYSMETAFGEGTGGTAFNGNVYSTTSTMTNGSIDASGWIETAPISTTGSKGYGRLVYTGTFTLNGKTFQLTQDLRLGQSSRFLKVVTTLKNVTAGGLNATNVNMWIGIPDDHVGGSDNITKVRGNIVSDTFTAITDLATQYANTVRAYYSTVAESAYLSSPETNVNTYAGGRSWTQIITNTNFGSPNTLSTTGDQCYAIGIPFGTINNGSSVSRAWYYGAGTNSDMSTAIQSMQTRAGPTVNDAKGGTVSTNIGIRAFDTITATGGSGITLSMDTAKPGISFDSGTGVVTLETTTAGTFTQTFTATDSSGGTGSLTVNFIVNALPTNSQTNSTLTTTLGRTGQETMTVAGGTAPFRFVKTSSNSQSGITIETPTARSAVLKVAATGVAAGTTTETITCTDAVGSVTVAVFTVVINPAITLVNSRGYSMGATVGTVFTETITATGGTTPRTFALSGTLSSGNIYLDTSTASSGYVLLKTLSALSAGTYYETVTATDTKSATATLGMKLTVTAPAVIGGGATSTFSMNQGTESYDTLTVTGGSVPLSYRVSSSPSNSGITISSFSNTQVVIKFASTVLADTYTVTVTSTDSATATSTHTITATVAAPLQWAAGTPTAMNVTFGTAKSQRIDVTGGFSGKAFTLTQGTNKSNGITLDTTTASSGYVTLRVSAQVAEGTYLETITATDSSGRVIRNLITLTVVSPILVEFGTDQLTNGYTSVKFNGSNHYLKLPGSTKYQLNSTWTLEWWQYETDTATYPTILSIGTGWAVRFGSAGTKLQILNTDLATLTPANYKNKWTHFAIVNNGGFTYVYVDGVAMNSTALTTVPNLTSTAAPATSPLGIAVSYSDVAGTSFLGSSYFGGALTNILLSKRVLYTGTSTTTANFTPSATLSIDSQTVLALTGINGSSQLIDISPNTDTTTAYNSPLGTFEFPKRTGVVPVSLATTQGRGINGNVNTLWFKNGSPDLSISWTNNITGNALYSSPFFNNWKLLGLEFSDSLTALDSSTARISYETATATDSNGASVSIPVKLTVNPPLSFTSTSLTPTTQYMVPRTDTVTAVFGTGLRTYSRSNPQGSGIVIDSTSDSLTVITMRAGTPVGTYYETITAWDSVGDSETVVLVMTVTPGLSLSAVDSVTSITTTAGLAKTLRINAINGSGAKTFTLTHRTTSTSAITLDTSTASSNYVTLNVGTGVTAGSYTERITVTDALGVSVTLDIIVTVNAAPTITYNGATSGAITLTTTAGTVLTSGAFTAALGTGSRTLSLSRLNSAITIDTSTANTAYVTAGSSLTATNSTTAKSYYDTMTVTDSLTATSIRAFTVVVNPAISLSATSTTLTTTSGVAITDTITATQGTGNKTFAITSSPSIAGITNTTNVTNQTTLTIPNTVGAGTYTITVTATDSVGATSSIIVTLNVNGSVVITGSASIAMTAGYAYKSGIYSVAGGTGSYSYALTGTLNSSYISLETLTASSFRLKITASATASTYSETVTVTDATGAKGIINLSLTVNPVVTLSGNQTINGTFGVGSTTVYQTSGGTAPFSIFGSNSCAPVAITDGSYTVLKFIGVGTCNWTVPNGVSSVEALVVAGGGAGGTRAGGGGGAGGVQTNSSYSVSPLSNISVTVGDGGVGQLSVRGSNGGNSVFGSITSTGGGSGGGAIGENTNNIYRKGADGGSGGGGAGSNGSSSAAAGSGIAGQGFGGGLSEPNQYWPGGGGGGATSAGAKPASNTSPAGKGGSGYLSSITGSSVCYATGGGAGTYSNTAPVSAGLPTTAGEAGAGGDCGGTASPNGGSGTSGSTTPSAAAPNSGAGGGGSGWSSFADQVGGDGASGVVVVRYLTPTTTTPNLITYVVDTYTVTGKIIVTVPDSVTVGTYTENITIKDSAGTSTSYTNTVNIAKATPTVSLSIPGGGSAATYGSPVSLTATSSTWGTATFKNGASNITGCVGTSTSGGSATCNWTPTDTSTVTMTAAFTPADTTNYNSVTSSNFVLSVNQADTLTVTFNNQTLTYSESGTAVSRAFTLAGLASIDTVTAVATAITGTANDSSVVNVTGGASNGAPGTSTVTKAGTFSLSGTGITFSGNTKASYYKAIAYSPGTITVNRASNPMSVNYGIANTITYRPTGTEAATVTYKGTGTRTFSTNDATYCTVDSSSGALTTVQAGSCDVLFAVADSPNFLGDTITATVRINKATRTVTAAAALTSLKYGETTTVSGSISADTATALMSISTFGTTGCTVDPFTGILTAVSGTVTCSFAFVAAESNNYLQATSNTVNISLSKADAPVLTLTAPANVDYSSRATSASMPLPTFSIAGLKLTDTLTALSGITISYVATGTYPYNSTTVPTGANVYTLTPTAITLSIGSMSNYNTPTFTGVSWTINQINQDTLTVKSLFQEGITVPYDIQYTGGSTNGTVTGQIVSGGTANSCSFVGINLRANGTGTCFIRLKMAGNQNYLDIYSDTYTVLIANFTQAIFNFDSLAQGASGITVTSQLPVTKGADACTSNCQPRITSVSTTSVFIGDPITLTGTNFATATEVIFNLDYSVYSFQIDNGGTTITVIVPADVEPGSGGINVRSPQGLSPMYMGITFKAASVG